MSENEKQRVSDEIPRNGEGVKVEAQALPAPAVAKSEPASNALHPAFYVVTWITMSSSVILFNKYLLDTMEFHYPIILTTWHLGFGTLMTQILARTTNLLDGRKKIKMTGRVYLRAIMPIGVFFSLSLICGNIVYLYLSVAFIQMLKAMTPVVVLLCSWVFGLDQPSLKKFLNVSAIVVGVMIASYGEIRFIMIGFLFQIAGLIFEAIRLTMIQRLLSSSEFKMDPLVSFYYFAPICAIMNGALALVTEVPSITLADISRVGYITLLLNALVAFGLNVSVVFLIGRTSSLVMTLCGVLKDILLVAASIAIWGTPVTGIQFFGYSIALGGMVYYKLGADNIKGFFAESGRRWTEYGNKYPAQRKIVTFVGAIFILFLLMTGLAPTFGYNAGTAVEQSKGYFSGILGGGKASN